MEFRIAKNEFLRGLRLAQGIADRKSTMPMLANVLLRTQGKNQLLVAATDLNVSLTAELKSSEHRRGRHHPRSEEPLRAHRERSRRRCHAQEGRQPLGRDQERQGLVPHRRHAGPRLPEGPRPSRGQLRDDRDRGAPRDDRAHAVQRLQRRDAVSPQRRVLRERRQQGSDGLHGRSPAEQGRADDRQRTEAVGRDHHPEEGAARDPQGPRRRAVLQAGDQDAAPVPGPGRHRDRRQADRRAVPRVRGR